MAAERNAAITGVLNALRGLYGDQDPDRLLAVCNSTCALFKSVDDLKRLAADAAAIFPTEFTSLRPKKVRGDFVARQTGPA